MIYIKLEHNKLIAEPELCQQIGYNENKETKTI